MGDLFTLKVMRTVGSSTAMGGSGMGFSLSTTVSPIMMSASPAIMTISPACTSGTLLRPRLSKTKSSVTLPVFRSPSGWQYATCSPTLMLPDPRRPMPSLPLKSS